MTDLHQLEPAEQDALRLALIDLWHDREPSPRHARTLIYALARVSKLPDVDEYLMLWKPRQ